MTPTYPIFFINLDKQTQRRAFMEAQFAHLGIPITRIPAALGADPEVRRQAAVASFASMSHGEIGCFESHRRFWKRVIDEDLPGAFILEDDVVVASDFARWQFPDEFMETCDIIKIDQSRRVGMYGSRDIPVSKDRCLRRFLGTEYATGCYFLTNRGARKLYRASRGYFVNVDSFMFDQDSKVFWSLEVWKLDRPAAKQYRHYKPEDETSAEMEDSISSNKRHGRDSVPRLDLWRVTMMRMRNLLDLDSRPIREARAAKRLDAFAKTEAVGPRVMEFLSATLDHIEDAERALKQEARP